MSETTGRRTTPTPTIPGARHRLVDALRGAALLGIVVVNVEFIVQHSDVGWRGHTSALDLATRWAVTAFGELKVYPLFALLSGYGLTVQLDHAEGARIGSRYGRRMVMLVVLGAVHAVVFFPGDILILYATVGAIAFLLRRRGSVSLIRMAVLVYAAASAVWLFIGTVLWSARVELEEPLARVLETAGRMSLTVYLLESVALSTLSYGYGLGLFGRLSPLPGVLLAMGVWGGLCGFALVWLRFARFGPVEWLLRSFSYWRWQPFLARREF